MNRSERATIRKLVTELCANYDSQDKICLPLDSPCYMLNKWWTGAYCRYFEKAVLPVDAALESAITGEDTSMRQKICPVCGKANDYNEIQTISSSIAVCNFDDFSRSVFWQ